MLLCVSNTTAEGVKANVTSFSLLTNLSNLLILFFNFFKVMFVSMHHSVDFCPTKTTSASENPCEKGLLISRIVKLLYCFQLLRLCYCNSSFYVWNSLDFETVSLSRHKSLSTEKGHFTTSVLLKVDVRGFLAC